MNKCLLWRDCEINNRAILSHELSLFQGDPTPSYRIIFDFCALEHLGENNPAANLSLGRQTRPKPVAQFRNAEEVDFVEQSGEICVIWVRNAPRSQEVKDDFKQARIAVDKYPILRVELQKRMEEIYLSV